VQVLGKIQQVFPFSNPIRKVPVSRRCIAGGHCLCACIPLRIVAEAPQNKAGAVHA